MGSNDTGSSNWASLTAKRAAALLCVSATVVAMQAAVFSVGASAASASPVACNVQALKDAVTAANTAPGGGSFTLASGCPYALTAIDNTTDGPTGLPVITGNVTIEGNGATIARLTAMGTPEFRIFDVATAGSLTLKSFTISGGVANDSKGGGGVHVDGLFAPSKAGALTATGMTFSSNSSPAAAGPSGGAIESSGPLTVTNSTFDGNTAQEGGALLTQNDSNISQSTFTNNVGQVSGGGAIVNAAGIMTLSSSTFVNNTAPAGGGGAIDNDGTVNLDDSTFVGNSAGVNGGGAIQNFGTLSMTRSTLSGNSAADGANVHNFGTTTTLPGVSTIATTIIAGGLGGGKNCSGTPAIIDGGYNLDSGVSCGFSTVNHSLPSSPAQLQPLAANGGPTMTMALVAGSAAIDAIPTGVTGCGGTDQRGVARPQGNGCDIGAFELPQLTITTQPTNQTAFVGKTATFTAAATGQPAPTVKWQVLTDKAPGWVDVPGATGGTLSVPAVRLGQSGWQYRAVFTNAASSAISSLATLTVITLPPPPPPADKDHGQHHDQDKDHDPGQRHDPGADKRQDEHQHQDGSGDRR